MQETIRHSRALASFLAFLVLAFLAATFIAVYQPSTQPGSASGAQSELDPNKSPSEFNHHVAGS